ncbi:hypothetical protein HDU93_007088 [Gonapodya sp. JEL0774]|nr:hypothetical protein HDU93_007088 [Gonapodya sp. JEL0774]
MAASAIPLWRRLYPLAWLLVLLIAAAISNISYKNQGAALSKPTALCLNNTPCVDSTGAIVINTYNATFTDGLVVSAHFISLDTLTEKITYRLTVGGIGKYSENLGGISIVAGDSFVTLDGTAPVVGIDAVFGSTDGDASSYPFDFHYGTTTVLAFQGTTPTPGRYIPMGFQNTGTTGSFTTAATIIGTDNRTGIYAYTVLAAVARSSTTKFFAVFTAVIQWGLALAYGFLTVDIRFKGKKLEYTVVSAGPALLFALTGLRNAAPGIPAIGIQLDMAGLFFALSVIGVCVVVNIFRFLYEIEPQTPASLPIPSAYQQPPNRPSLPPAKPEYIEMGNPGYRPVQYPTAAASRFWNEQERR